MIPILVLHSKCGVMCWTLVGCVLAAMPVHLSMHHSVIIPLATKRESDQNDPSTLNTTVSNFHCRDNLVSLFHDEKYSKKEVLKHHIYEEQVE